MREILFRGKRIDNGEWVYGGYFADGEKHFIIIKTLYMPDTRDWDTVEYYEKNPTYTKTFIEVIPSTISEFTGLTDKHRKKIFEGDIVEANSYAEHNAAIYQVKFSTTDYCFGFQPINGALFSLNELLEAELGDEIDFEVFGNIYDIEKEPEQ